MLTQGPASLASGSDRTALSTPGVRPVTEPAQDRLVTPLFLLITFSGLAYFMAIGSLLPVLPRTAA